VFLNRRVLVTRAAGQASELADVLRELGMEPVMVPVIEVAEPASWASLDSAIAELAGFDWLLFTSANAVEAFARREGAAGRAAKTAPRIAAIGDGTARAVEEAGMRVELKAELAVAESLAEALMAHVRREDGTATRMLLVRAEEAREVLPETLRSAGADVTVAAAYRNVVPAGSVAAVRGLFARVEDAPAAITFTSSSSARNLLALCEAAGVEIPAGALRISIGPITSATLRELGYPAHAEAATASVRALAEAVRDALAGR
jgi:uroporphyrinogen-III synthase